MQERKGMTFYTYNPITIIYSGNGWFSNSKLEAVKKEHEQERELLLVNKKNVESKYGLSVSCLFFLFHIKIDALYSAGQALLAQFS